MKVKIFISFYIIIILLFITACSSLENLLQPDNKSSSEDKTAPNQTKTDNSISNKPQQRWSRDEFRYNEEDVLFFTPITDDYMLTESYLNEQPDTGIIYTLTILRSFDESGKVVSQQQKYYFDIPQNAMFAYNIFIQDGNNYPSLVCVGYAVILEQTADVVEGQRTKEQFVNDYNEDGITKYWLSKP